MEVDQVRIAYTWKMMGISKEDAALFLEYGWQLTPDVDTDPITVVWPFEDKPKWPPGWETTITAIGPRQG